MKLDWRLGAELFQWLLTDHDLGSNWGNWRYFSGVGDDPKHRHFKTISQGMAYDADGSYVQTWLPLLAELAAVVGNFVHLVPLILSDQGDMLMQRLNLEISDEILSKVRAKWPKSLVDPMDQITWSDRARLFEYQKPDNHTAALVE